MSQQDNWRWCNKCQGLAFAGNPSLGPCPAGGQHNHTGSGDYVLVQNDPAAPGQSNWRWCNKCQGLAFAGNPSLGPCPAGSQHNHTGSGDYVLVQNHPGAPGQSNWRWCNKCQGLAFAGNPSLGPCPAGGQHNHTGSGNYVLVQAQSRYLGLHEQHQDQSEWCWSATTVSITLFYNAASTWTQCLLVNQAFGQTTCCQNGSSAACNQPWYPDKALTITGHLASTSSGKPSLQTIIGEINAGHPVSIAIYWNGGGGHNPAVDGYDNTAVPTIDLQDPWYGPSTQDFNTFPGSYQGGATWGESYFTK
jgi:hypothetical protein